MNKLYYGDNLEILRLYIQDESVDLIYLDPPFNSNANYNVLFSQQNGSQSSAQIQAFEDTWRWDEKAARACELKVELDNPVGNVVLSNLDQRPYGVVTTPVKTKNRFYGGGDK